MCDNFITPKQFEDLFKFKRSTQAKYRMTKSIPFIKVGKFIFYEKTEIEKWFKEHRVSNI